MTPAADAGSVRGFCLHFLGLPRGPLYDGCLQGLSVSRSAHVKRGLQPIPPFCCSWRASTAKVARAHAVAALTQSHLCEDPLHAWFAACHVCLWQELTPRCSACMVRAALVLNANESADTSLSSHVYEQDCLFLQTPSQPTIHCIARQQRMPDPIDSDSSNEQFLSSCCSQTRDS